MFARGRRALAVATCISTPLVLVACPLDERALETDGPGAAELSGLKPIPFDANAVLPPDGEDASPERSADAGIGGALNDFL